MAAGAGKIAAIICSIVGPTIAILVWLSITFSHREEKHIVTCGVVQHIAVSDISSKAPPVVHTWRNSNQPARAVQTPPPSKSPFKLRVNWASFSQACSLNGHSTFSNGQQHASGGQQATADGQAGLVNGQDYALQATSAPCMRQIDASPAPVSSFSFGRTSSQVQARSLIPASRNITPASSQTTQQVRLQCPNPFTSFEQAMQNRLQSASLLLLTVATACMH